MKSVPANWAGSPGISVSRAVAGKAAIVIMRQRRYGKLPRNWGFRTKIYSFAVPLIFLRLITGLWSTRLSESGNYNRDEVAELFSVPLSWFLQHEPRIGTAHIQVTRKDDFPFELVPHLDPHKDFHQEYPIYFYQYGDKVIWGMTAAILHSFLERFGKGLADFA